MHKNAKYKLTKRMQLLKLIIIMIKYVYSKFKVQLTGSKYGQCVLFANTIHGKHSSSIRIGFVWR